MLPRAAQRGSAQGAPAPLLPSTPLHLTRRVLLGIYTLSLDLVELHWEIKKPQKSKKIKPHHNAAIHFYREKGKQNETIQRLRPTHLPVKENFILIYLAFLSWIVNTFYL